MVKTNKKWTSKVNYHFFCIVCLLWTEPDSLPWRLIEALILPYDYIVPRTFKEVIKVKGGQDVVP